MNLAEKVGYTPGPWFERYFNGHTVWGPCGATGSMMLANCGHADTFDKANARLISAAPAMLETLVLAVKQMDSDGYNRGTHPVYHSLCNTIEAATGMTWEELNK